MKAITFIIKVLVFLLLIGCQKENITVVDTNTPDTNYVDFNLVGTWTFFKGTVSRNSSISGIKIGSDKSFHLLGAETATGKLAQMEDRYPVQLLRANSGILILKHNKCMFGYSEIFNSNYRVEGWKLILPNGLWGWQMPDTMYRKPLGSVVTTPMEMAFSFEYFHTKYKCLSVSDFLPAYVAKGSHSLFLYAALEYPGWECYIIIDSFKGPGTYTIGDGNGHFQEFCDDISQDSYTLDSLTRQTITIDTFDEVANRCSGAFEFSVLVVSEVQRLRNGKFSVPFSSRPSDAFAVQRNERRSHANIHLQNTKGRN